MAPGKRRRAAEREQAGRRQPGERSRLSTRDGVAHAGGQAGRRAGGQASRRASGRARTPRVRATVWRPQAGRRAGAGRRATARLGVGGRADGQAGERAHLACARRCGVGRRAGGQAGRWAVGRASARPCRSITARYSSDSSSDTVPIQFRYSSDNSAIQFRYSSDTVSDNLSDNCPIQTVVGVCESPEEGQRQGRAVRWRGLGPKSARRRCRLR
jgi:hypothetical protein